MDYSTAEIMAVSFGLTTLKDGRAFVGAIEPVWVYGVKMVQLIDWAPTLDARHIEFVMWDQIASIVPMTEGQASEAAKKRLI